MYVADLAGPYRRAEEAGLAFVNTRFKRRAHTLEEAVEQCMFRYRCCGAYGAMENSHPDVVECCDKYHMA
jgi:hypothetical protein